MENNLDVVPHETGGAVAPGGFFNQSPRRMLKAASEAASILSSVIRTQGLSVKIGKEEYVKFEGWSLAGAFLGLMPKERRIWFENNHWFAEVDIVSVTSGLVIGGASAMCGRSEPIWAGRPANAQRSMAITRASGKAYRLAIPWIIKLAGYATTPFEEMGEDTASSEGPPAKEETPKTTTPLGFDPKNPGHLLHLKNRLAQRNMADIPEADFSRIAAAMAGRQPPEMDDVIANLAFDSESADFVDSEAH